MADPQGKYRSATAGVHWGRAAGGVGLAVGATAAAVQSPSGWWTPLFWSVAAVASVVALVVVVWPAGRVVVEPLAQRPRYHAEPVVYSEGRWWLRLARKGGRDRTVTCRCQVRRPDRTRRMYQFAQADGSALAWYPQQFGDSRPLANGNYKVRWKVFPQTPRTQRAVERGKIRRPSRFRRYTVAKGEFTVEGDAARVERLCTLLDTLICEGNRLVEAIPSADMTGWSPDAVDQALSPWRAEATPWASEMDKLLGSLPDFTPWTVDGFPQPGETWQQGARRVMRARVDHLNELKERFQ